MQYQLNQPLNQPYTPTPGIGPVYANAQLAPPAHYAPAGPGYTPVQQDNPFGIPQDVPHNGGFGLMAAKGILKALIMDLVWSMLLVIGAVCYHVFHGPQLDALIVLFIGWVVLVIVALSSGYDKVPISMPGYLRFYNIFRFIAYILQIIGGVIALGFLFLFTLFGGIWITASSSSSSRSDFFRTMGAFSLLSIVGIVVAIFGVQQKSSFDQRLEGNIQQIQRQV